MDNFYANLSQTPRPPGMVFPPCPECADTLRPTSEDTPHVLKCNRCSSMFDVDATGQLTNRKVE